MVANILPSSFEIPRLKIERAAYHLDAIDGFIDAFKDSHPYTYPVEVNTEKTFYDVRIKRVGSFDEMAGIHVGEFLYQMRSILDNLIYSFSEPNFPSNPTDFARAAGNTMFPIVTENGKDIPVFRLKWLNSRAVDLVHGFQPDVSKGSPPPTDALYLLEMLHTRDKHRVPTFTTDKLTIDPWTICPGVEIIQKATFHEGDVIARVPIGLDPETCLKCEAIFKVFVEVRNLGGADTLLLRNIHEHIRDEVLPAFANLIP